MPQPHRLTAEDLTLIRQHTDWRQLFSALRIAKDRKKSRDDDWWGTSPLKPDERTASFHINDRGWYCHATGQGGGPIELVQRLHPGMNCYAAGKWLLEKGVSRIVADTRTDVQHAARASAPSREEGKEKKNRPIRQDLRKQLNPEHPSCTARGLSPEILRDLGAGYLERPPRKNGKADPLNQRIVFQIRGLKEGDDGYMRPVILGHIGRATTTEQAENDGKWWTYSGFRKSLELFNLDRAILDDDALDQAKESGHFLIVEGPIDLARLLSAGIHNVVATLGAHLSPQQIHRLDLIDELTGVNRFRFFYDRDDAGQTGTAAALQAISISGLNLHADAFDWNQTWTAPERGTVGIPPSITDPAEFSLGQLQWLREEELI